MKPYTDAAATAGGDDLEPGVRRFVRAIQESATQAADDGSPAAARRSAELARARWCTGGPAMAQTRELEAPTRHGGVRLRLHRPAAGRLPALVYLHGGGWTLFSIDTHDRVMREYAARAGIAVIGVDYALAPEAKYPVALEQVVDVIGWLREGAADLGVDAERVAVGGDSAGANLSVAACLSFREAGEDAALRGMLLNYGAFVNEHSADACRRYGGPAYMLTCEEMMQFWSNYLRDEADARDPLVCPLRARLEGLPPAFVAIAECDILAEQNALMADKLRGAGVPTREIVYRGASHSFIEAVAVSEVGARALADGARWLEETL